jgi:ATP-dependent Lhr-like helicase
VERLRAQQEGDEPCVVLSAVDPAQPYGAVLPWPRTRHGDARRPARVPGAYAVLCGGQPIVYLERGGKGLQTLVEREDRRLERAVAALVEAARRGTVRRIALEKVDGEPAMGSPLGPVLVSLGFQQGPRRLTLSA